MRIVEPEARAVRLGEDAEWLQGADMVVVRGRSTPALTLASWAEAAGVPTVNTRAATEAVRNKAELAVALAHAGIPCPTTFVGTPEELAAALEASEYPILLKPVFGDNSRGLRLVNEQREMRGAAGPQDAVLAQRYVPSDGIDLKLYVIGDQVFAVRKPSPFDPDGRGTRDAAPDCRPVTLEMRELALRCGRLFGLELYGVDCIEGPDGPVVIEVNEFPNYTGVPGVDDMLADRVMELAADAAVERLALGTVR